jgi:thiol-disulfide isomerase/thioredoxin
MIRSDRSRDEACADGGAAAAGAASAGSCPAWACVADDGAQSPQWDRRSLLRAAALATAAAATSHWSAARAQQPGADRALPAVGTPLPLAEVPLLDGSRFLPASADGRVLVLYWWASWCPFCAEMSPLIDALWRAQAARGLMVLGLSIDKSPADALGYLRRKGLGFPSGFVTPEVARALPKPKGLPVTVVRGRDGRVLMAEAGQLFPEDVQDIALFL